MRVFLVALCVVLTAAGCGGGGGGSSPAPSGGTVAVATAPPASLAQNTALQRSLVQEALTSTNSSANLGTSTGSSASATLALARRAMSVRRSAQTVAACSNGQTSTITAGATSTTENLAISQYYDVGCTELWWTGTFVVTLTSNTSFTAVGSYTYYTTAGVVYESANPVTLAFGEATASTPAYTSTSATIANSVGGSPIGSIGVGCTVATASDSCAFGSTEHLPAQSIDDGQLVSVTASEATTATGDTVTVSGSGSAYTAALNALSLAPQGTAGWTITGAAAALSIGLTGSVSYSTLGVLTGISLAVTDSADAASVAVSYNSATQLITGTVTQTSTGSTVATFSVSPLGSGTISYGNGSTGTIVDWIVQS
jgi:hypothetical protein